MINRFMAIDTWKLTAQSSGQVLLIVSDVLPMSVPFFRWFATDKPRNDQPSHLPDVLQQLILAAEKTLTTYV